MPRHKSPVKNKLSRSIVSSAAVDLHFHGAYGIDVMTARRDELDVLGHQLLEDGVGAYLPTTFSAPSDELANAVTCLGRWIRTEWESTDKVSKRALPLGIHLEGPFINPKAAGAHDLATLHPANLDELESLRIASQNTLRLITMAPETVTASELVKIGRWSKKHNIRLSLGHSQATEDQAYAAFTQSGFSSITHTWNALSSHHRQPGAIGALTDPRLSGRLGKSLFAEIIIDGVHVAPAFIRILLAIARPGVCFISDCTPAAGIEPGTCCCFGSLNISNENGAARIAPNGALAGGATTLAHAFARWFETEAALLPTGASTSLLRKMLPHVTKIPLAAIAPAESKRQIPKLAWEILKNGRIKFKLL